MNYLTRYGKQKGIGLIEVLIATVVVAVGLLAVASLQGDFMSGSGTSKTSAEAIKWAEVKTEEFRNNSTLAGFTAKANGTDTVAGSNATFTRTWTVTALTNADGSTDPTRKKIVVGVTWPPATAAESVNITSQIAWLNPGNSAQYATAVQTAGVAARAPDPNQNSSMPGAAPGQPSSYTAGTGTDLADGSNLRTHTDGVGNIVLLNAGGTVLNTFFGGKINTFKGTAYTVNSFATNTLIVSVSENAGYCVFTSAVAAHGAGEKRDYICYTGGNCKDSTAGSNGCPASPTAAQLAAYNKVGPGGWYGNIGPLKLDVAGGDQEKVCFIPHVTGFAARGYSTVRTNGSVITSEGINRSFACHDFLVVDQTGATSDCATVIASFGMSPEPQKITRTLTGTSAAAPNTVLNEDTSYCAVTTHAVTVTLTVTGGYTLTSGTLSVSPASGSGSCTGSGTSYSCTVPDSVAGSLNFTGLAGANSCTGTGSYVASSSAQSAALTIACTVSRDITVTVTPDGTGTVTGTTVTGTGATCVGLTCTVADTWSGTLAATGTCSGTPASVSGTSATIASGAATAGITLATCTASNPTVTGTLSAGTARSTSDIGAISLGGVGCTKPSGYSCTVPAGLQTLSVTFTNGGTGASDNAMCIGSTKHTVSPATQSVTVVSEATALPAITVIKGSVACP